MVLVLQIAAGVFLANLLQAVIGVVLHRLALRRRAKARADTIIDAIRQAADKVGAEEEAPSGKPGQYL